MMDVIKEVKNYLLYKRNYASPNDSTFDQVGEVGDIRCLECDFSQQVIGFSHAPFSCHIGRQCQKCGTFFTEYNESDKYHQFGRRIKPVRCPNCQKEYKDSDTYKTYPLFCPRCKSKRIFAR